MKLDLTPVLQIDPSKRYARHSEGAFVTLDSGRILFAYTRFGESSRDHGSAVVVSRYSDDGGATWSTRDKMVIDQEGTTNVMSVSLLRLADGRIAMVNLRKDGSRSCMPWIRFSENEGRSFGPATCMSKVRGYYVVNNDRLIQLSSGRLVAPAALHRFKTREPAQGKKPSLGFSAYALCICLLSDDGGKNWYESRNGYFQSFPDGGGLQEPGVIELRDGRLWSWARAGTCPINGQRQWESFSEDGGLGWGPVQPTQFISPCSPMSVKRLPTGDLLTVWNDRSGQLHPPSQSGSSWGRSPLACAISSDEGKTWSHRKLIETSPDHGFCYTAIHCTPDHVLLAYCAGGPETNGVLNRLRMQRISLKQLYA